jgi:hypothetical protein
VGVDRQPDGAFDGLLFSFAATALTFSTESSLATICAR